MKHTFIRDTIWVLLKKTHNLSTIQVAKNDKNSNIPSTEELVMYVLKSTSVKHIKFMEGVLCIDKWHL